MEASAILKKVPENPNLIDNDPESDLVLNYEDLLDYFSVDYQKSGPYLIIGLNYPEQCWVIYISVVKQQMAGLMNIILPLLIESKTIFLIPQNSAIHTLILDGGLGYSHVGKIIAIYPNNLKAANDLAKQLVPATSAFNGPVIPFLRQLGGCLFADFETCGLPLNSSNQAINNSQSIEWPFKNIAEGKIPKNRKWLKRKYFQVQVLKNDVKGIVYKGLNLNKWSNIQWCIIKQGKRDQGWDNAGRNIKDRLKWQFELQTNLIGIVPLPSAIDFFEENGDTYLIMEYIEGISLEEALANLQNGTIWYSLEKDKQLLVINYLLQVVEITSSLHSQGYIHRDLSPANFMVNHKNEVIAIDIELCYDFKNNCPKPAYTLGTPGYMSPAQSSMESPQIADDIYGLGGMLLNAFTGMFPTKFNCRNTDVLFKSMNYFIGNHRLASLICACLSEDCKLRPELNSIKHNLELYHSILLTNRNNNETQKVPLPDTESLKYLTENIIRALSTSPLLGKEEKWYSKSINNDPSIANEIKSYEWYPYFNSGTSGIMYTLTIADQYGFGLDKNWNLFNANFSYLKQHFENNIGKPDPGLYSGAAGFCVVMAKMIRFGILEKSIQT